ncbi:MAG: bifunctional 3-(3-hydroxy-phenyl)propionate/3-hydroxycinnamic acid hydroxylase [Dermatophilus congolensis]|nr:bifunctional 3-(3-hydroxy-phenyl)propionate/3-hydroxycinnamic acid hydroxylase [Dermatophilus congolensis]
MTHTPTTPTTETVDVAVIGLGPVGATLANLLTLRGVRTLVIEKEREIYSLPRAIQFDGEVLRVFQTIGIADLLMPDLSVARRMRFVDTEGHVIIDWQRPHDVGPIGWHSSYRFHQPTLEGHLRDRLASQPNAEVLLGAELLTIEDQGTHVDLQIHDGDSDQLVHRKARYVVGCDGARSTVRRVMGTTLDDLQSHERWLVVDVLLDRERPDLDTDSIQYCDPARPATYVPAPHNRRRWELMLLPGEDPADMSTSEAVWRLLSPWVTPEDGRIERPAAYTFHSVVARGWRQGRLLLAGDACHQTPPFMGQGMCAGIRDASNLAWKLADVVAGRADESLLDTYESERSPHVREFIETAVRLGRVIQTTDPDLAEARNARMRREPEAFRTPRPLLGPGAHAGAAPAGDIGDQPWLPDGRRTDDLVGYHYCLLVAPEHRELAEAAAAAASTQVTVVDAVSQSQVEWLSTLGAVAVLVRPDRYIAATASEPGEVAALTSTLARVA